MSRSLQEQILSAFDASGLTILELRQRSGIECSEDSLGRKLRGKQTLRSGEVEALASALGIVVAFDGAVTGDQPSAAGS